MIAPTPGSDSAGVESTGVESPQATPAVEARITTDAAAPAEATERSTPDWTSPEGRAREMLERLGRGDHPDFDRDPINALYQVAVDYRCSAHGYRELYLHHMRHVSAE